MDKERLSAGKLRPGGLSWNSVIRITDHPDMASAVYRGRRALNQTNETKTFIFSPMILFTCTVQCEFYRYRNDSFKKKNVPFFLAHR